VPPRGTRPGNRRALIIDAATTLFAKDGYANVGMGDIAASVNIGASAIYRHFPSKSDLLVACIQSGLAHYVTTFDSRVDSLDQAISKLAEGTIDNRLVGVLWQREARNLDEPEQRALRAELRSITLTLATLIQRSRAGMTAEDADLLAWCTVGVMVSIGFHTLEIPRRAYVQLLVELSNALLGAALPVAAAEPVAHVDADVIDQPADSTREGLITVATRLFAERGFAAVGVDDIADAIGIAGPSIYYHFANKQAILASAIEAGNRVLQSEAEQALALGGGPKATLTRLIDSYVRMAASDRSLIRMLLSEMNQLSPTDLGSARREQRRYIDIWCEQLRQFSDIDLTTARIMVQAVLLIVNDAVQTPHLRSRPGFDRVLASLAGAMLGL
jgi:AcrR family transcriptional regulator